MKIFETLRAIRDLRGVAAAHKAVLYAMVLRSDGQTGECWPSYPTLAADAGVSLALAKRAVKELERAGHIAVSRRHVEGTRWSQVNRYVVRVRHDPAPTRDRAEPPIDDLMSPRAGVVAPGHDVVSRGDDVVRDDPADAGHDEPSTDAKPKESGDPVAEPASVRGPHAGSREAPVVSPRHEGRVDARRRVVSDRYDGGVHATRGVVSPRHEGRVAMTPDLPNELPQGRTFALTRPDDSIEDSIGRRKKIPKHSPELIAAKNAVVTEFVERCEATKGARPKKIHERDHAAAFALAKTYGADEGRTIVRRAFEDEFVLTKNTTLAFIESKAETYRGHVIRTSPRSREIQALVGDEPWLKEHCP